MTRDITVDASNTNKATIVDNDRFPMVDSETTPNTLKEVLWSLIKSTLKTYFDTLYAALTGATFTGDVLGSGAALYGFKGKQNVQTDSYTTVDGDNGKVIVMNKATAVTLTIHQAAAADFNCLVIQKGAGQVTVAAGGTGAVRNRSSQTKIAGQYGVASIYVESNAGTAPQVYLIGDTGA